MVVHLSVQKNGEMKKILALATMASLAAFFVRCDNSDDKIIPEDEFPNNSKLVTGIEKHTAENQLLDLRFTKDDNPNSLIQNYSATISSGDSIMVFIP